MRININVKSASRRKAAVTQLLCEYPDRQMTVEEFIAETVRQNVEKYNERKGAGEFVRLFSRSKEQGSIEERTADMVSSGKVAYGEAMDGRTADAGAAIENALQCFDDGVVALFADGARYTKREEPIPLKESSEVTFVRLVFLAGRMW